MKISILTATLVACMALLPSVNAAPNVRVEAELSTDHNDPKGTPDEVVSKQLTVTLRGAPELQSTVVTVIGTFYADDLTTGKMVIEKEVVVKASLERGRAVVELPEVVFRYTPTHGKIGNSLRSKAKRIPASGRRYHGWSVRVMDGENVLGQASSYKSLDQLQDATHTEGSN